MERVATGMKSAVLPMRCVLGDLRSCGVLWGLVATLRTLQKKVEGDGSTSLGIEIEDAETCLRWN
jgi:hypothetical protein